MTTRIIHQITASWAENVVNSPIADTAVSASYAETASLAENAVNAGFAEAAVYADSTDYANFCGEADTALSADAVRSNTPSSVRNTDHLLLFVSRSNNEVTQPEKTGSLTYNYVSETLKVKNLQGTASYAMTASTLSAGTGYTGTHDFTDGSTTYEMTIVNGIITNVESI